MALGSQNNKRRRRRRSASVRASAQPIRVPSRQSVRRYTNEILSSLGVVVVAVALVALVWIMESRAITTERSDLRARIEATVSGQALVLAGEIQRELLGVDQSLRLLKIAVEAHPANFDIQAWREQIPVLTDVTSDVFVANEKYIIQYDTNPASVGLGIGANVATSGGATSEEAQHENGLIIAPTTERVRTKQHLSYMMMRLDHPGGWLVGATYRTDALAQLYTAASLGVSGMTALINTQLGRVQAISGPAAADPNYDISNSAMFAALRDRPQGSWVGPSAPGGVQRIHGFREVPGRKLAVVVAVDEAEAMRPVESWADGARSLARGATLVILIAAGLMLHVVWTHRTTRRLRQTLDREGTILATAQQELSETRTRLESRTTQLQTLFGGIEEGVLVLDRELRAVEWSPRFAALFGVSPDLLQPGQPFDEILRSRARDGAFGAPDDLEAEVARRVAELRSSDTGERQYVGPDGRSIAVTARDLADGGVVLLVREAFGHAVLPSTSTTVEPL
jgi:PAS domain-containing protein